MKRLWQQLNRFFADRKGNRKAPKMQYTGVVKHDPVFVENYTVNTIELIIDRLPIGAGKRCVYLLGFPESLAGADVWALAQTSAFLDIPRAVRPVGTMTHFFFVASTLIETQKPLPYAGIQQKADEVFRCLSICHKTLNRSKAD